MEFYSYEDNSMWALHEIVDTEKLMQYTWLKDKEWKDIYEWDIIMYNMSWQNPKTKVKAIVPYMLEPVYWELPFHWFSELQSDAKSIEVIWNIFENPELIDN